MRANAGFRSAPLALTATSRPSFADVSDVAPAPAAAHVPSTTAAGRAGIPSVADRGVPIVLSAFFERANFGPVLAAMRAGGPLPGSVESWSDALSSLSKAQLQVLRNHVAAHSPLEARRSRPHAEATQGPATIEKIVALLSIAEHAALIARHDPESDAARTLTELGRHPAFAQLSARDRQRLSRYAGGTNELIATPARARLALEMAAPEFQASSTADQSAQLELCLHAQLGLRYLILEAPQTIPPKTSATVSSQSRSVDIAFTSGIKPATRHAIEIDGREIPVLVPQGPAPSDRLQHTVEDVRDALARLPKHARDRVRMVHLDNAPSPYDLHWQRVFGRSDHAAYMSATAHGCVTLHPTIAAQSIDTMTKALLHETGHLVASERWGTETDARWNPWKDAIQNDGLVVSEYARNDAEEDFAETYALHGLVLGTKMEAELRALFPARFAILDELALSATRL